ncbi:amidohydrolase family protein [Paenibacillus sabuli]|uniref:amidohydrolase family protein n=1 Tax=Paenibacillus sabuli TaxID=2772509 RepID=UPI00295A939C|nr:amidohydrolase family protein [Paenibacillus sabuli]
MDARKQEQLDPASASGEGPGLIDTDVHNDFAAREDLLPYLPKVWHAQWLAVGTGVGSPYYSPVGVLRRDAGPERGGPPGSDPHYLLRDHLERFAIDYAILTGAGILEMSLNPDCDYANAAVSAYNDYLLEQWLPASPRFKGSIVVNHADPAAAAREIDRLGGHPDLVQVIMCSGARTLYGQRCYHPIYEAAQRHGLPVAFHPGTEGRGVAGAPTPSGYPSRYMEWHNALPGNYMAHLNSLVCEGVFEKYPELRIVAIEGGIGWLPHLMWRMDKNYKALRDSVPWLRELPSTYLRRHVYLTTQPIEEPQEPEHLAQIFRMCGAEDRVMYASDYPHWDFDPPKFALASLPREMRAKVRSANAAALYGLTGRPPAGGRGGASHAD